MNKNQKINKNENWNGNMFIIIPLLVCVIISIAAPVAFYCLFSSNDKKWCSKIPNLFTTDGLYNEQNRFEASSIIIFIFIWVATLITWIFVLEFTINAIILKKNYKNTYLVRTIDYFKTKTITQEKLPLNNNIINFE